MEEIIQGLSNVHHEDPRRYCCRTEWAMRINVQSADTKAFLGRLRVSRPMRTAGVAFNHVSRHRDAPRWIMDGSGESQGWWIGRRYSVMRRYGGLLSRLSSQWCMLVSSQYSQYILHTPYILYTHSVKTIYVSCRGCCSLVDELIQFFCQATVERRHASSPAARQSRHGAPGSRVPGLLPLNA